jgi:hypothetical protein
MKRTGIVYRFIVKPLVTSRDHLKRFNVVTAKQFRVTAGLSGCREYMAFRRGVKPPVGFCGKDGRGH